LPAYPADESPEAKDSNRRIFAGAFIIWLAPLIVSTWLNFWLTGFTAAIYHMLGTLVCTGPLGLLGFFLLAAALDEWASVFNARKARRMRGLVGNQATRAIYLTLAGIVLFFGFARHFLGLVWILFLLMLAFT
jgi:hypothetical protein